MCSDGDLDGIFRYGARRGRQTGHRLSRDRDAPRRVRFERLSQYSSDELKQRDFRIRHPDTDRTTLLRPINYGDDDAANEALREALCQLNPADGGSADDRKRIRLPGRPMGWSRLG